MEGRNLQWNNFHIVPSRENRSFQIQKDLLSMQQKGWKQSHTKAYYRKMEYHWDEERSYKILKRKKKQVTIKDLQISR